MVDGQHFFSSLFAFDRFSLQMTHERNTSYSQGDFMKVNLASTTLFGWFRDSRTHFETGILLYLVEIVGRLMGEIQEVHPRLLWTSNVEVHEVPGELKLPGPTILLPPVHIRGIQYTSFHISGVNLVSPFTSLLISSPTHLESTVIDLHVCQSCFLPFIRDSDLHTHRLLFCRRSSPPGRCIYSDGDRGLSVNFIDGAADVMFTRSMAVFGKVFLDKKDLVNDVSLYEFYCVTTSPSQHCAVPQLKCSTVIGYFCRRKNAPSEAMAALVVFPPFQRRGFGSFMLDLAYHLALTRQSECGCKFCGTRGTSGRIAGPFSQSGKKLVEFYWEAQIARVRTSNPISLEELSFRTGIHVDDLRHFLRATRKLFYATNSRDEHPHPVVRHGGVICRRPPGLLDPIFVSQAFDQRNYSTLFHF